MTIILGVLSIAIGSLAAAGFYAPINKIKNWSWESSWLIQGSMAWIIGPWLLALITIPGLFAIYGQVSTSSILLPVLFGLGWGIGGLTWGLSIRYLGIGLGNSLPLGITLSLATLVPVLFKGNWEFFQTLKFVSVIIAIIGVAVCGVAGTLKEKDTKGNDKTGSEFNLKKGILFALIGGVFSACFAFGEEAGDEIFRLASELNPDSIWNKNGVFSIILVGGFITNAIYCTYMNVKNKSHKDYKNTKSPLLKNYVFALLAGAIWFSQFVFKGIGTSINADLQVISWSLLFSCTIIFSNIIGIIFKEWSGVTKKTMGVLIAGILILVISTIVGVL